MCRPFRQNGKSCSSIWIFAPPRSLRLSRSQAVDALLDIMYQAYYDHLKEYFGTVIKMTFYDEPALHHTNGRHWTPGFNRAFQPVTATRP